MKTLLPMTVIGLFGLPGIATVAFADDSTISNQTSENAEPVEASKATPEAVDTIDSSPAPFANVQQSIDKALTLLAQKPTNPRAVLKHLSSAKDTLSCPKDLIDPRQVSLIWVLEGYAYLLNGDDEGVQLAWDQAFTIYDEFDFTEQEIASLQLTDDVLNAVVQRRGMVMDRGVVDLHVPDQIGTAELFANGKKVRNGDAVYPGNHVLQIACPDDGLQSRWVSLEGMPEEAVDWFGFCPSGVTVAAAKETADSGEMNLEDFGFGFDDAGSAKSYYNPSPICPSTGQANLVNWILMGSGGALLASGAMSYGLWVVPAFEDIQDGRASYQTITRAEADDLTAAFQAAKGVTWALLGAGTAAMASGAALEYIDTPAALPWLSVPIFPQLQSITPLAPQGLNNHCGAWDLRVR